MQGMEILNTARFKTQYTSGRRDFSGADLSTVTLDSVVTRFQPIARGIGFGLRRGTKRSSLRTAWQYRASA